MSRGRHQRASFDTTAPPQPVTIVTFSEAFYPVTVGVQMNSFWAVCFITSTRDLHHEQINLAFLCAEPTLGFNLLMNRNCTYMHSLDISLFQKQTWNPRHLSSSDWFFKQTFCQFTAKLIKLPFDDDDLPSPFPLSPQVVTGHNLESGLLMMRWSNS